MRIIVQRAFAIFILFCITSTVYAANNIQQVFVFGDSLSDTGNGAYLLGQTLPPLFFYNNHLTNGPVAVEAFVQKLNEETGSDLNADPALVSPAGTNYAVATARARNYGTGTDLQDQINYFAAAHGDAPKKALYLIFIGGNDIRDARALIGTPQAQEIIADAISGVENAVAQLYAMGARNVMLINAPDIGDIPETRMAADILGLPLLPALTTALTKTYNFKLFLASLKLKKLAGLQTHYFNLFLNAKQISYKAATYGIENNSDACLFIDYDLWTVNLNPLCADEVGMPQFDKFYYFDTIHPTAKVHGVIGERMAEQILPPKRHHFPFRTMPTYMH